MYRTTCMSSGPLRAKSGDPYGDPSPLSIPTANPEKLKVSPSASSGWNPEPASFGVIPIGPSAPLNAGGGAGEAA